MKIDSSLAETWQIARLNPDRVVLDRQHGRLRERAQPFVGDRQTEGGQNRQPARIPDDGGIDLAVLAADRDLDSIRDRPDFRSVVAKARRAASSRGVAPGRSP